MAGSDIDEAIGRLDTPPPPQSTLQTIIDFISKYWQFAGVLASIFVAVSAGFAYFATQTELVRVECQMSKHPHRCAMFVGYREHELRIDV